MQTPEERDRSSSPGTSQTGPSPISTRSSRRRTLTLTTTSQSGGRHDEPIDGQLSLLEPEPELERGESTYSGEFPHYNEFPPGY